MDRLYKKYQGHLIENDGAYKSRDFVNFANYAKRRMKAAADEKGIELVRFMIGHYDICGFFRSKETGKYAYFSFSDCRYKPLDFNKCDPCGGFLLRTAKGPEDYIGGQNRFTNLNGFISLLEELVA